MASWRCIPGSCSRTRTPPSYQRWDLTAWGDPIRMNGFEPDGRWFGQVPELVFAADGDAALEPRSRACGPRSSPTGTGNRGDYQAWPGPNSNTFVATVMAAVPEIGAALPPDRDRQGFPGRRPLARADAIPHRLPRDARRLCGVDGRLGGGHRGQPVRRRDRLRHSPPGPQIARRRPHRSVTPAALRAGGVEAR